MILVTGGAGFIGANFVLDWLSSANPLQNEPVVNLDKLTYAGNLENLSPLQGDARHTFCLLYTSPSPRDGLLSRMPSSA